MEDFVALLEDEPPAINNLLPVIEDRDGSIDVIDEISSHDIIRADLVDGVMLYSVRTPEKRRNRREPPEELQRFFPGLYSAPAEYWQSHSVRNISNMEIHLMTAPRSNTKYKRPF